MTNSTLTFWSVDGVSLQTMAYDIESLGGDRNGVLKLRGDNYTVPSAPGSRYTRKVPDERVLSLGMWVIGADEDWSPVPDVRAQFWKNWRKLKALLWTPNREVEITKRWYDDAGVLRSATGRGQFTGGLDLSMDGAARGQFTVDFLMADPYFYGPEQTVSLVTGANTLNVLGDDLTRAVQFEISGSRLNPKIRNVTLGVDVEYHADVASGDKVFIDVSAYSSVTDPSGSDPYKSVGSIRHSGDPFWFLLFPGTNNVLVSSSSGSGLVAITYSPVYV